MKGLCRQGERPALIPARGQLGRGQGGREHSPGRVEASSPESLPLRAETPLPTKPALPVGRGWAAAVGRCRLMAQADYQRNGCWGRRKERDGGNLEGLAVSSLERGEGGHVGQEALPGCSFCSEVASARTGAGGHGVWATRGKWSEGSGSGPAFPLKAKGLDGKRDTPNKLSALGHGAPHPAHLPEVRQEAWLLYTPRSPEFPEPQTPDFLSTLPSPSYFTVPPSHTPSPVSRLTVRPTTMTVVEL